MFENGRKVWWPIETREYNESGEEVTRKIVVCYLLETAAQRKERAKSASTAMLADARKRLTEIMHGGGKGEDGKPLNPAEATDQVREQLDRIAELDRAERAHNIGRIVDWRGIEIDGEPAEYSEKHRDQLMAFDDWASVLSQGYVDCCKGAVAKN